MSAVVALQRHGIEVRAEIANQSTHFRVLTYIVRNKTKGLPGFQRILVVCRSDLPLSILVVRRKRKGEKQLQDFECTGSRGVQSGPKKSGLNLSKQNLEEGSTLE